jgi:streptogramin lyase
MRTMRTVLVAAILVLALISSGSIALAPVAGASPKNLKLLEWPVPTGSAKLGAISEDSSGRIWFTENSSAKLGLLDPVVNKIYEWGASANSHNIVTGRAGAFGGSSNRIYFAEYGSNKIAFLDNVTGYLNELTEFGGFKTTNPVSVAIDNSGNIWFTESGTSGGDGYIGELSGVNTPTTGSPTAQLIEWKLPAFSGGAFQNSACNCQPWGIYVNQTSGSSGTSPDTYVWFTEKSGGTSGAGAIGKLQKSKNILTMWDLGASPLIGIHGPTDITVDSSGNVYWTNSAAAGNSLSLLANGGNTYKEYALATTSAIPVSPFPDRARSAVWALEYAGNNLLYLDTTAITTTGLSPVAAQCTITSHNAGVPDCQYAAQTSTSGTYTGSSHSLSSPTVTPVNPTSSGSLGSPTGPFNGLYEYSLLSASAAPYSLFLDANENLWLTESSSTVNRIAEIQFPVDFTMQLTSSSSQSVSQGGSVTYSVSVTPATGLQTPVTLSVNAPSGLSASFSNSPGTPPFTSTLTISTSGSTTPTTYAMTITGTSSSATHSLSITLTVTPTTVTTTTTSTTSNCGFDYQITADQTSQILVEGDSGSYQLHVLQTCPTAAQQPVTLTVTLPTGVTDQFTANGLTPSYDTQLQVQVAVDAPVTQSATISVSGTSPGGPAHTLPLTLQITAVPRDFSLAGSGSVSLYQASRQDIILTVTSIGYFDGPVQFTVPAPSVSGLSGSVSPNPVTLSPAAAVTTTLEIVAQKGTPAGSYQLTVTGSGTTPGGPVSHDFQVSVTVTSGLPCLIATATFGSPLAPEVQFLRDFRDHQILHTFAGSNFMLVFNAWYYSFSPGVAGYENLHPTVKSPMQYFLTPLLGSLHISSWTYASLAAVNPEIASLIAGLVGSSLIGLLYLALPLAATLWLLGRKVLTRAGSVKTRLVRFFVASITAMIILFAISELFTLAIPMMVASASLVLLGLTAGSIIPSFELIDRLHKR